MKIRSVAAGLAGAALALASAAAMAADSTGKIALYHLNSEVEGRGVCVQMTPALPNTWACLWKSNPLYSELTGLLLQAFITNKTCTIIWRGPDPNGWHQVAMAECRP